MQLNLAANGLYMPDYEAEKGKLRLKLALTEIKIARLVDFITTYEDLSIKDPDPIHGRKKYMIALVSELATCF